MSPIMKPETFDVVIVGGGILGLAIAQEILTRLPKTRLLLLEKEGELARHQSGRNSGVLHSGIYYKPGSLKARFCVEGGRRLLAFCQANGISAKRCGKVIVATVDRELEPLHELFRQGEANGVADLALITPEELREIEPAVEGLKALHVPSAAIVDFTQVALLFAKTIQSKNGTLRTECRVLGIEERSGEQIVKTTQGEFTARLVINCAGLYADRIAQTQRNTEQPRIIPFRGEYFMLSQELAEQIHGLIYPIPDPRFPFLGIHVTRMIDGRVEVGPNAVLALAREGYRRQDVNLKDCWEMLSYGGFWQMVLRYGATGLQEMARSMSKKLFLRSLQRLVPLIELGDLLPADSGVRAQAVEPDGKLLNDFKIVALKGAIHLLNAPSPAATSCLPIADHVVDLATQQLQ